MEDVWRLLGVAQLNTRPKILLYHLVHVVLFFSRENDEKKCRDRCLIRYPDDKTAVYEVRLDAKARSLQNNAGPSALL